MQIYLVQSELRDSSLLFYCIHIMPHKSKSKSKRRRNKSGLKPNNARSNGTRSRNSATIVTPKTSESRYPIAANHNPESGNDIASQHTDSGYYTALSQITDSGYDTASQNPESGYDTDSRLNTLPEESAKPNGGFTATVNVTHTLPLPEKCIVHVTDIGDVPVELHHSSVGDRIARGDLKRLDSGLGLSRDFINEQFIFGPYQTTKFILKVRNRFGQYVGYVVGVFSYSLYDIDAISYLSSEDLHRNKRGRKNSQTSMPAGTRQINAGDPYVELTLVGLDEEFATTSGFNGYHLLAICIGLVNDYHLPPLGYYTRLPDLETLIKVPRPLNGLAYPFYASSVPWALEFYKRNGFMTFPPIGVKKSRGKIVKIYRNKLTGSETISSHEFPVFLPA